MEDSRPDEVTFDEGLVVVEGKPQDAIIKRPIHVKIQRQGASSLLYWCVSFDDCCSIVLDHGLALILILG